MKLLITRGSDVARNSVVQEDLARIVAQDLPWGDFSRTTVLIAGANGFLPAYMVDTLLYLNEVEDVNCRVIGLVRNRRRAETRFAHVLGRPDFSLLIQDVCSPLVLEGSVDFIIHAASEASPKYYCKDPAGTLLANALGTYNLLEIARKSSSRGFLFFSSGEVYGKVSQNARIKEDDFGPLDPTDIRSCYGEGKRMGEAMCVAWHRQYGIPAKIVRISHTYGPGLALDDGRVFADFVGNIVRNEDIVLKSDGSARRPFCYLADATLAFFTVLLRGEAGQAYNVANDEADVSMLELAERLVRVFPERRLAVKFAEGLIPTKQTPGKVTGAVPDTTKLRKLGWRPAISIEEGFKRTVKSFETPRSYR
jgi:nucleoside-diphosphate-sugar epimerase